MQAEYSKLTFGLVAVQTVLLALIAIVLIFPDALSFNSNTAEVPRFTDQANDADGAGKLNDFLLENDGKIIYLETLISEDALFSGNTEAFTLVDPCEEFPEHPTACGGAEVGLLTPPMPARETIFAPALDDVVLKGYFHVAIQPGMHQGFISIALKEIPYAEARMLELTASR